MTNRRLNHLYEFEIINADESESITVDESESVFVMSNINAYEIALRSDNEDEVVVAALVLRLRPAFILACLTPIVFLSFRLLYRKHLTSEPLWPMLTCRPSIPKCSSCGSDRAFEFQILPQLIYFFEVKNDSNSLDWATIVVYTCEASCDGSQSYEEEFSWVQLMSQSR
ncbi:hypothetical protein L1987_62644 [Smallanthus sonchifolius]|uniref:Uncharacterized protein n=1 Tax=Smallanthus sonchifolius TaxID=185202 RepID=A0ACB9CB17_9ASTR|nr:hypothetical protein L1987_62644 [Smallanthus sonchifolius]